MLTRVISGGQSGADVAGLKAAYDFGIPTGGVIPSGFRTLDGPKPEYETLYGLEEHESPAYPPRTIQNVINSDGTLIFAKDWNSLGEKLTLKTLHRCDKPYLKIDMSRPKLIIEIDVWLGEHNIQTLNIAGNSEQTCQGIERCVYLYLITLFTKLGFKRVHTSIPGLNPVQV